MEGNITWIDRLETLSRYRRFLLRWLLFWIVAGVVAAFVWPPRYRAEASFLPPTEDNSGLLGALGPQFKISNSSDIEGGGFFAVLHSHRLRDSLDLRYDFRKRYSETKLDKAYASFDDHIEFATESEEGIGLARIHAYYIRVNDKKPEDAAAIANSIIHFSDRIVSELTSQRQRLTREFLETRVSASKESLRIAEDSLRSFSQRTGIIAPDVQIEATIKALASFKEQIAATDVQLHVIRTTMGNSHPSVREIEERRKELEKLRDELSGKLDQTAPTDMIGLRQSPDLALTYSRLYRKVRTEETLFAFLATQLEQARIGELRNAPVLRVLDYAKAPESRKWPIRSVVVILGLILGLISGLLWVGWVEWLKAIQNSEFEHKFKSLLTQYSPKTLWHILIGKEE